MKDLRLISSSDKKDERLSNFTENIEVHFASRKKKEILGKTRKLLLSCDFAIPQVRFFKCSTDISYLPQVSFFTDFCLAGIY